MAAVGTWLLVTLMSVLLLVALLTAIPLVLRFRLSSARRTPNEVTLEWAFGLVRVPLSSDGGVSKREDASSEAESPQASASPEDADDQPPDRPRRGGTDVSPFERARRFIRVLRDARLRRRLLRFLRDCWRAVHKRMSLHARIGLGDPADTGQLWGLLGPLTPWLAQRETATIQLEPDFAEATFDVDGEGVVRLIPLQLLWLGFALMLSPALWRGVATLRGAG